MKKLFLSYKFDDQLFVQRVNFYLRKQPALDSYCYADERHKDTWIREIGPKLEESDAFILFAGKELGKTQHLEAETTFTMKKNPKIRRILVELLDFTALPATLNIFNPIFTVFLDRNKTDEANALHCAEIIAKNLTGIWIPDDDLPIDYLFDYEKDIIKEYLKEKISNDKLERGCPPTWVQVTKRQGENNNPLDKDKVGAFRDCDNAGNLKETENQILVASSTEYKADELLERGLIFPEAGPRKKLYYPRGNSLNVGILVSGGIAPGINAVISGIVERQYLYAKNQDYGLTVYGYYNGLSAFERGGDTRKKLKPEDVKSMANLGGSILGTSRVDKFMDKNNPLIRSEALEEAIRRLKNDKINILYIIGGDGSMRAAHALSKTAENIGYKISIVAVPKTMDNDILWVWQSFGFLSAVECSKELIRQLHTEAQSNPRLCVIQLFGSDSGFVVTHAAMASEVCDFFLIPEVKFDLDFVSDLIIDRAGSIRKENNLMERYTNLKGSYGVVVMAETAIPINPEKYFGDPDIGLNKKEIKAIEDFRDNDFRVFGQTSDELRSGGLKIVSRYLQKKIKEKVAETRNDFWEKFRVFTNEPRHLIRSIPPSSSDVIFAHRLGTLAVDCAMAGYTDFMISQWLTEYVMVPLKLVTLGRKRVPKEGIFYKSVCASTGQPIHITQETNEIT